MRKAILILIAVAIVTSCKKDRTCTCTGSDGAGTSTKKVKDVTKRQARNGACVSYTESFEPYMMSNGTTVPASQRTVNCKLK